MIPWEFLEISVTGMGLVCTKITRMMGNFTNNALDAPRQLRCFTGQFRLVNLTEINTMDDSE